MHFLVIPTNAGIQYQRCLSGSEASTFDELVNVATELTPELLELNHVEISGPVSLHITAERTLMAKAA